MKQVNIYRGIPGSGKSTLAKDAYIKAGKENQVAVICSADHFFELSGKYVFDASKLTEAHAFCFRSYLAALQSDSDLILVDNTNTSAMEMAPYILGAQAMGYHYNIIGTRCSVDRAYSRQKHGVPFDTITRMSHALGDKLPPWWNKELKIDTTGC